MTHEMKFAQMIKPTALNFDVDEDSNDSGIDSEDYDSGISSGDSFSLEEESLDDFLGFIGTLSTSKSDAKTMCYTPMCNIHEKSRHCHIPLRVLFQKRSQTGQISTSDWPWSKHRKLSGLVLSRNLFVGRRLQGFLPQGSEFMFASDVYTDGPPRTRTAAEKFSSKI